MKRQYALCVCIWFLLCPLTAETLKTIKTQYFDIIYDAESSSPSAVLLAEHADGFADEICANLNKALAQRLPVYLVRDTDTLNGYYTCIPYRRIVLYDTAANDGILGNLKNTILDVFYHELTHAVTLQSFTEYIIRFPFLPMSFTEGVAVSFESLHGYGRLNDPLARQYLIQHKIDGQSPSWQEAAGPSDMYPGGLLPYIYGGFFAAHLQKKYGMDAYAKLWHDSWRLFIPEKFRAAFKQNIKTEWKCFLDEIPVPEVFEHPRPFSELPAKSGYTILAASPKGFAYYDFDKHGVFFYERTETERKHKQKPKKLFTADHSLHHLSFSADGTLLAVSDAVSTSGKTTVQRSRIFDMESKTFTGKPILSSRGLCFIDKTTLCALIVKDQVFSAVLLDRKTHAVKKTLYTAGQGKPFSALYSPCSAGNGTAAFIAANGVQRTIIFADIHTGNVRMLPEDKTPYALRYLQAVQTAQGVVLSFSWAEQNMLYRMGLYNPATETVKIQEKDISGGVFYPVVLPAKNTDNHTQPVLSIVYAGIHRNYHRLYTLEDSSFAEKTLEAVPLADGLSENPPLTDSSTNSNTEKNLEKQHGWHAKASAYQPAEWLGKVSFLPNMSIPHHFTKSEQYGFGLQLVSEDPAERIQIDTAFLIFPRPFFLHGTIALTAKFRPVSLIFHVGDTIDTALFSWRSTVMGAGLTISRPLRDAHQVLSFTYTAGISWIGFPSQTRYSYYTTPYRYTLLLHEAEGSYQNIRSNRIMKTPFFAKETRGIRTALHCAHSYCLESQEQAVVMEAKIAAWLPLLPVKIETAGYLGINAFFNPNTETYTHLQTALAASRKHYMPAFGVYRGTVTAQSGSSIYAGGSILCDLTVFSYDMQAGSFFLPVFYNRIEVHAGYAGIFTGSAEKPFGSHFRYFDTAYINAVLTLNRSAEIGIEYAHPLRKPRSFGKIRAITRINF